MTKAKHTVGPWEVVPLSSRAIVTAPNTDIYNVYLTEETDANARLIAAAPELLEVAKIMLEYLKDKEKEGSMMPIAPGKQKLLRAVIDKAEGK